MRLALTYAGTRVWRQFIGAGPSAARKLAGLTVLGVMAAIRGLPRSNETQPRQDNDEEYSLQTIVNFILCSPKGINREEHGTTHHLRSHITRAMAATARSDMCGTSSRTARDNRGGPCQDARGSDPQVQLWRRNG